MFFSCKREGYFDLIFTNLDTKFEEKMEPVFPKYPVFWNQSSKSLNYGEETNFQYDVQK